MHLLYILTRHEGVVGAPYERDTLAMLGTLGLEGMDQVLARLW